MIVKNEERTLPRLAASLDGQLDHWTIVDTGSTDGTVALAEELFAGVPGEVIRDRWRGYGPSRTVALEAGRSATQWLLTLDADDTVHGELERSVPDGFDGVEALYDVPPLRYWVPRLMRSDAEWEWHGRAHEYLACGGTPGRLFRTGSFSVHHHADGGNRATKLERELGLLRTDQRESPQDPRTLFYLARTYEDMGETARAVTWFRKRIEAGGWEEETWYATWCLGRCLLAVNKVDEGCGVLWSSWNRRPWRAEPLWTLAQQYRLTGQWQLCVQAYELAERFCGVGADDPGLGFHGDRLFVHQDVYQWRLAYEASVAAYYLGDLDLGRRLTAGLLARDDLPVEFRTNIESNQRFYVEGDGSPGS